MPPPHFTESEQFSYLLPALKLSLVVYDGKALSIRLDYDSLAVLDALNERTLEWMRNDRSTNYCASVAAVAVVVCF